MPNWIPAPDAPGYWWWRPDMATKPSIFELAQGPDRMFVNMVGLSHIQIERFEGLWQRVAPPLDK